MRFPKILNRKSQSIRVPQANAIHINDSESYSQAMAQKLFRYLIDNGIKPAHSYQRVIRHSGPKINLIGLIQPTTELFNKVNGMRTELAILFGLPQSEGVLVGYSRAQIGYNSNIIIEVPKPGQYHSKVSLNNLIKADVGMASIGVDVMNQPKTINYLDDTINNTLICGTSRSGKTTLMKLVSWSLMVGATPHDTKFLFIDAFKAGVKWGAFANTRFSVADVAGDMNKAAQAIDWAFNEMVRRYQNNDLNGYRLYIVIDEFTSFMTSAPKPLVEMVSKIMSLGVECGIRIIAGTQVANSDVLGKDARIRANMTTRICGKVENNSQSNVALGAYNMGAESLQTPGDFILLSEKGRSRIAVPLVNDNVVNRYLGRTVDEFVYVSNLENLSAEGLIGMDQLENSCSPSTAIDCIDEKLLAFCIWARDTEIRKTPMGINRIGDVTRKLKMNKEAGGGYGTDVIRKYVEVADFTLKSRPALAKSLVKDGYIDQLAKAKK